MADTASSRVSTPRPSHHVRTPSNTSGYSVSSSQSAPAALTPTMEHLMRTIAQAPKGSKVAQDASKALAAAEREHYTRGGRSPLYSPPSSRPVPIPAPVQSVSPPRPSRPFDPAWDTARIGQVMLGPNSLSSNEDAFEYDRPDVPQDASDLDDLPELAAFSDALGLSKSWSGPSTQPVQGATLSRQTSLKEHGEDRMLGGQEIYGPSPASPQQALLPVTALAPMMQTVHQDRCALAIFWRGQDTQTFLIVTDGTGLRGTDDAFPVTVQANHTQVIEMPLRWMGRIQKVTADPGTPATRCYVAFGGFKTFNFFHVSYVYGNNGPLVARAVPSDVQSGASFRALDVAPPSIMGRAGNQTVYIYPTNTGTSVMRHSVTRFYRNFFSGPQFGAILPEDDAAASQVTRDRHVVLDFG